MALERKLRNRDIGKWFKSRNGNKVRIDAIIRDRCASSRVCASYWSKEDGEMTLKGTHYSITGKRYPNHTEYGLDLVARWDPNDKEFFVYLTKPGAGWLERYLNPPELAREL